MTIPDPAIPSTREDRDRFRRAAEIYVRRAGLLPPTPPEVLRHHAQQLRQELGVPAIQERFLAILIHNALWWPVLGALPYVRRVLMLPQCLRSPGTCGGRADALGIVCARCGACPIGRLETLADGLGCASVVAEGTTIVTGLLAAGRIDGVIGVGCLDVLEKAFPHLLAHAIPALAVPLLRNGCRETAVDVDWVEDALRVRVEGNAAGLATEALRGEVESWFSPDALDATLGPAASATERLAREWLTAGGKRWRPLLLAATYQALVPSPDHAPPSSVRRLGVAVECFHKASLVHDDIEDDDERRYGRPTLPRQHGIPLALNVGDLLVGEGYRLIAHAEFPPELVRTMLQVAAEGHRTLCLGQGEELKWRQSGRTPPAAEVLTCYRKKTAPAFEVALRLGALAAGADAELGALLRHFSEALGTAYQIRDDLEDAEGDFGGEVSQRPLLLAALAAEEPPGLTDPGTHPGDLQRAPSREAGPSEALWKQAVARAQGLLEHFHREAILALENLRSRTLKLWLHRFAARALRPIDRTPM